MRLYIIYEDEFKFYHHHGNETSPQNAKTQPASLNELTF